MNLLMLFNGYKTVLAALGMMGLGLYQMSQGQGDQGVHTMMEGLALLGIRSGLEQVKVASQEQSRDDRRSAANVRQVPMPNMKGPPDGFA